MGNFVDKFFWSNELIISLSLQLSFQIHDFTRKTLNIFQSKFPVETCLSHASGCLFTQVINTRSGILYYKIQSVCVFVCL